MEIKSKLTLIKVFHGTKAEGIISSLAAMVVLIGTLALFIVWFVLNVNNFQMQTALNLSLKRAMTEGYLSPSNITITKAYLSSVGLPSSSVSGPLTPPSGRNDGTEIQITITASSMPLPAMDNSGHAIPDSSRSTSLTSTGYIISQYVP